MCIRDSINAEYMGAIMLETSGGLACGGMGIFRGSSKGSLSGSSNGDSKGGEGGEQDAYDATDATVPVPLSQRVRILTADSTGQVAVWCAHPLSEPRIDLCQVGIMVPSQTCHWLTPAPNPTGGEVDPMGAFGRTGSHLDKLSGDSVYYTGFTLSPTGSVLVAQGACRARRTTHTRCKSFIASAPLLLPVQALTALLWAIILAAGRVRCGGVFALPLIDAARALAAPQKTNTEWPARADGSADTSCIPSNGGRLERSREATTEVPVDSACSVSNPNPVVEALSHLRNLFAPSRAPMPGTYLHLEAACDWFAGEGRGLALCQVRNALAELEALVAAAAAATAAPKPARPAGPPGRAGSGGPAEPVGLPGHSEFVETKEQAMLAGPTAAAAADAIAAQDDNGVARPPSCGEIDGVSVVAGSIAGSAKGASNVSTGSTASAASATNRSCKTTMALQEYWRERFALLSPAVDSAGSTALEVKSVLSHLQATSCEIDGVPFQVAAPCKLCGTMAKTDAQLLTLSCGRHTMPLCQWSLAPLFSEQHTWCRLCRRASRCCDPDTSCASVAPPGICAWCATHAYMPSIKL
eukprot:NODE_3016_length_2106_cov_7.689237.p1 GENE.NODE_3016_length_2106_cov_7.689237~~NODE_3016_length_2106_cov_7.689237.p1  ORF type:complete len:582 (+),score=15.03 NODE_3016_length_2106_cov_7.689237:188-1933(+)